MATPAPTALPAVGYPVLLEHIRSESRRFREVLAECDPAAPVPACPGWDAADLLWHLTEVQWFWTQVMAGRPAGPPEDVARPERAQTYDGLLAAFDTASTGLVAVLASAGPEEAAWHWSPVRTVGTTYRRQAHEALIHRLDAEQTAGAVTPLDPVLAADGVLELLEVMYGGEAPSWGRIEHSQRRVRVDLVDLDASIWVEPCDFVGTEPETGRVYDGPHVLVVDDPGRDPDTVVSGRAADLDAWLWRRRDDSAIAVRGDRATFDAFHAAVSQPLD